MKTIVGKIEKVWGCITTCDDRLIVYQVIEQKTKAIYYILKETSLELHTSYIYGEQELPSVVQEVLLLCQFYGTRIHHDTQNNKYLLYGPHLAHKTEHFLCEIPVEYMHEVIEYKKCPEDAKIKKFYQWLHSQLHQGE